MAKNKPKTTEFDVLEIDILGEEVDLDAPIIEFEVFDLDAPTLEFEEFDLDLFTIEK